MKTFVAIIRSRNGNRTEERYPIEDAIATDPVLRGNYISSITARQPNGKTLVNWKIED